MTIVKKHWYIILITLTFIAILFINYFDVFKYNYHVPPGSDPVTHVTITKQVLEGKLSPIGYPPGFHIIIAALSKIFVTDVIKTMVYFYPFLMFLSALAVFLFTWQFFGKWAGFFVLIIYGFISPQPRQTLWDGGFPNVITADFLMILGFLFFLRSYKFEKWRDVILAGLILGAVPFFHHLSSYLMVFLLIFFVPSLLIFSIVSRQDFKKKLQVLIAALTIAFLIGAYPAYIYFGKGYLMQIANQFMAHAASLKGFIERSTSLIPEAPPFNISWYALVISPFVWFLGLLSVPFLFEGFFKDKKAQYLFIFVWLCAGILISRPYFFSPLPGRFTRELAIPFSIASGVFITHSVRFFKKFWPRVILITLFGIILFLGIRQFPNWVGKYNPMVFINDLDKQALDWVKENTTQDAKIAVTPFNPWFYLLTERKNQKIGTDFSKIDKGEFNYLYINRFQNDWMWGENPAPFQNVREQAKARADLELIKTFGENNVYGIAIYRIKQ